MAKTLYSNIQPMNVRRMRTNATSGGTHGIPDIVEQRGENLYLSDVEHLPPKKPDFYI